MGLSAGHAVARYGAAFQPMRARFFPFLIAAQAFDRLFRSASEHVLVLYALAFRYAQDQRSWIEPDH